MLISVACFLSFFSVLAHVLHVCVEFLFGLFLEEKCKSLVNREDEHGIQFKQLFVYMSFSDSLHKKSPDPLHMLKSEIWYLATSSTTRGVPRVYPLFCAKWLPEAAVNKNNTEPVCDMTWLPASLTAASKGLSQELYSQKLENFLSQKRSYS